uniref:Metalloendopeptidase n=1 Tax=Strongyloides venezuelensis TaxID=75913 RepID=A0A0K0EVV7_STRVS
MISFIKLFLFYLCIREIISNKEGTFKTDGNLESYETRIKKSIYNDAPFEWSSQIAYFCRFDVNKTLIREALSILQKETCLKFNETIDFSKGGLRYVNASNGCFSSLGKIRDDTWQAIVIGRDCSYVMGVLHETLHALGVIHEMSRHDRDSYIDVKYENIQSAKQHNFDRYDLPITSPHGLNYDFGSIMHYSRYLGTKNEKYTMVPKGIYKSYLKTIGQTTRAGFNDLKQLNIKYCSDKCRDSKLECKMGGYPDPNKCTVCKCPEFYTEPLCTKLLPSEKKCGPKRLFDTKRTSQKLIIGGTKTCYYQITAPKGRKVRLYIEKTKLPYAFVCQPDQGLEIKFLADKSVSGAMFCGKNSKMVIISENNVVAMKYVGLTSNSTIEIKYRDVK